MRKFLKTLRIVLLVGWYLLGCFFAWIIRYSNHPEKYPLEKRYARTRKLVLFVMRHVRMDLKWNNLLDLNGEKALFFAANHVSALDPLILICLSKKPVRFIAKKETRKLPFAGRVLRAIGCFFLDREDPRQAIGIFKEAQKTLLEGSAHICIFPEGTRNRKPYEQDIGEFHPGSFKIPQRIKCAVYPIALFGTFDLLGTGAKPRHLVEISFLEEIPYEQFAKERTNAIAELTYKAISECFKEERARNIEYKEQKLNKKKQPKWWKEIL